MVKKGLDYPDLPNLPKNNRYWMRPGETRAIIFLQGEDDIMQGYEHQVNTRYGKINVACSKEGPGTKCVFCDEYNLPRSIIAYTTVLDETGYTARDGTKRTFVKKIYALKRSAGTRLRAKLDLKRKVNPNFDLKFARFIIKRLEAKSPVTGDEFEYADHLSKEDAQALLKSGIVENFGPLDPRESVKSFSSEDEARGWYEAYAESGTSYGGNDSFGGGSYPSSVKQGVAQAAGVEAEDEVPF